MTICIIDDHQLLAQSLKEILRDYPDVTAVLLYLDSEQFLAEKFIEKKPDIVIADMMLPGLNALELIAISKPTMPDTKFILLTSLKDTGMIKESARVGFDAYITKDASKEELFQAIGTVLAGRRYVNQSMKDKLLDSYLNDTESDYNFTTREREVLQKICSGNTPKEIAYELGLSLNTVQEFIARIMRKMNVTRTTDLVLKAIKSGLYHLH